MINAVHLEYFRPSLSKCSCKSEEDDVWLLGDYNNFKWHTVKLVCKACWGLTAKMLLDHAEICGCEIKCVRWEEELLPDWIEQFNCTKKACCFV